MGRVLVLDHRGHRRLARSAERLRERRARAAQVRRRRYQEHATTAQERLRQLRDRAGEYGLGERDMAAPVNFFSKVVVDERGDMQFVPGHSPRGRVRRAAGRDERAGRSSTPASIRWIRTALRAEAGARCRYAACRRQRRGRPCRISRPENGRGFTLTERYFLVMPGRRLKAD